MGSSESLTILHTIFLDETLISSENLLFLPVPSFRASSPRLDPIRWKTGQFSRPASDQTKLSRFLGERFRTAAARKQVAAHRRGVFSTAHVDVGKQVKRKA